jgi:two-component sensor histidine kinase
LLSPYTDGGDRIVISGDDPPIDDRSATALALFFHELATNAAKYGALSVLDGQVRVRIAAGEDVVIGWSEHGGPPPQPSGQLGFGSTLVEMSIARQLDGRLAHEWHPEGFRIEATIPAAMLFRQE